MRRTAELEAKYDRWYERALAILEGQQVGLGLPVMRALSQRGHAPAMMWLAAYLLDRREIEFDPRRGLTLARRVVRQGESWQIQNLSTSYGNLVDMPLYRYWLRRDQKLGNSEIVRERRGFRTRFPHDAMRRWGRYRPYRASLDKG